MSRVGLRAVGARGAGVVEYGAVLAIVAVAVFIGASALGNEQSAIAIHQGECVRRFDCDKRTMTGGESLAINGERNGVTGVLAGVEGEALAAFNETRHAVVEPRDLVRGAQFAMDNPSLAARAIIGGGKRRGTAPGNVQTRAESTGGGGARIAASMGGPSLLGRVAKIGEILRKGENVADWTLPPAPEAPEVMAEAFLTDSQEATPSPAPTSTTAEPAPKGNRRATPQAGTKAHGPVQPQPEARSVDRQLAPPSPSSS